MGVRRFRSRFRALSATGTNTFTSRLMACSPPTPAVGGHEDAADRTGQRGLAAGAGAGVAQEHVVPRRPGPVERPDARSFGAEQPDPPRGAAPGAPPAGGHPV